MKTFERFELKYILVVVMLVSFSIPGQAQDQMKNDRSVAINIHDSNMEWGNCPDFMPAGCNVAILHGDPAAGNADAVFKIQPDTDIPEHWHNSAERMILIQGELDVTYEGEKTQTLKAGYYVYGPSKKPHTARCGGDSPCILFVAFEKPVDAFPGKSK